MGHATTLTELPRQRADELLSASLAGHCDKREGKRIPANSVPPSSAHLRLRGTAQTAS
jgi:hypothetical protein